jgi:2'-5' RNA ligase
MSGSRQPPLRTFFALWPGPEVRAELARLAAAVARASGGRPTRPETLHLTLVFIGATPRERLPALEALMDSIQVPRFALRLDQTGWWRHNGIAWAGTRRTPEALLALQDALARGTGRLGFSLDVRPWSPHLTLARDARRGPPAEIASGPDWNVDSFALIASDLAADGPRYRILHESPLQENLPLAAGSN